ncbi:hypothetical protein R1sor_015241 [Riccia sorocarpa]|uniref:Uncharacterized protein n=1 Tax=Riccia sorocarpa TaxID=122646 RepID=A0ABD3HEP5_9MARC
MEEAEARLDQGSEFKRYIQRIDPARYALYVMSLPSKTIPVIMETELAMSISCRAPPPAIRTGRHRVVRIPNGGSTAGASTVEFEYPLTQEPRVIPAATIDLLTGSRGGASGRRNTRGRCCGVCREAGHNRTRCPVLAHMT